MKYIIKLTASALALACIGIGCTIAYKDAGGDASVPSWSHDSDRLVVCHYFNWFKTPEVRGSWHNWEWKGNGPKHDPENFLEDGRRDIASVYYPRIGPYDSADPDVIEYHMLSALASKIDGFFIDWYGIPSEEEETFPTLLDMAERFGFKMSICFEDKAMFGYYYGVHNRKEAVQNAVDNMNYILETHAKHPAYLHIDGVPVIINFSWSEPSPSSVRDHAYGFSASEWEEILRRVREKHEVYFVHDYHCHIKEQYWNVSDNVYPWLDVNGECLDAFYRKARERRAKGEIDFITSLVYPGFDNTGVWGWGEGPFVTSRENGQFYRRSWERALDNEVRFVQIATWNDFGEGATIEPTIEHGTKYLQLTEEYAAQLKGIPSDGAVGAETAYAIYNARRAIRQFVGPERENFREVIDAAVEDFVAGAIGRADEEIARLLEELGQSKYL